MLGVQDPSGIAAVIPNDPEHQDCIKLLDNLFGELLAALLY